MKNLLFHTIAIVLFPLTSLAQDPVDTTGQVNGELGLQFSTASLKYPSPEAILLLKRIPKPTPRFQGIAAKPVVDMRMLNGWQVGGTLEQYRDFSKRYQIKDKDLCYGTKALIEFSFFILGDLLDKDFDSNSYNYSPWFKPY